MARVELTPFLTVKDARAVVEFYKKAFGATEHSRQSTPTGQFIIEMSIDGERFYAVDENPAAFTVSPATLGGTSVRLSLIVDDPDAVADRAVAAGGKVVFPVADQPYGMRQGRIADPEPLAHRQAAALAGRCRLLLHLLLVRGDHLLRDV